MFTRLQMYLLISIGVMNSIFVALNHDCRIPPEASGQVFCQLLNSVKCPRSSKRIVFTPRLSPRKISETFRGIVEKAMREQGELKPQETLKDYLSRGDVLRALRDIPLDIRGYRYFSFLTRGDYKSFEKVVGGDFHVASNSLEVPGDFVFNGIKYRVYSL